MVLAAHTLKQIQHLQAIDKGSSSLSNKIKQNSRKNYKIPQSLASIPFFASKIRTLNRETQVSMILLFNKAHPEKEKLVEFVKSLEKPQSSCVPILVVNMETTNIS